MRYIISDIDWTVANLDHRLHYITWKKKDYDAFYDACGWDTPIEPVIDTVRSIRLLQNMSRSDSLWTIFVSWRSDRVKDITEFWLKQHCPIYEKLYMRPHGDNIPDVELKKRIYDEHLKDLNIFCVFDDRPRVVQMRRDLWLFVFDVNHRGEF